jgi:hypothetical protein
MLSIVRYCCTKAGLVFLLLTLINGPGENTEVFGAAIELNPENEQETL